jgi:hypothetical protein
MDGVRRIDCPSCAGRRGCSEQKDKQQQYSFGWRWLPQSRQGRPDDHTSSRQCCDASPLNGQAVRSRLGQQRSQTNAPAAVSIKPKRRPQPDHGVAMAQGPGARPGRDPMSLARRPVGHRPHPVARRFARSAASAAIVPPKSKSLCRRGVVGPRPLDWLTPFFEGIWARTHLRGDQRTRFQICEPQSGRTRQPVTLRRPSSSGRISPT